MGFNVAPRTFAEVAASTAAPYIVFTPEIRTDASEKGRSETGHVRAAED